MASINPDVIHGVYNASTPEELGAFLQGAVELEHATIPPYLTAMFTLKPGVNDDISSLIRSIVIEEMLHMTIASNILIAIGGAPAINVPGFIPTYPGPLPYDVGGSDFKVPIEKFSMDGVRNIFMHIEEPEEPIDIPGTFDASFETIGAFYNAIKLKLHDFGDDIFHDNSARQVLVGFDPKRLFAIVDVHTACTAIDVILTEGEGSSTSPFESPGDPAHYDKFDEITQGHKLIKVDEPPGFAFSGDPIPFDESGVYDMPANVTTSTFKEGTPAHVAVKRYASIYSKLLNSLHDSFNGNPDQIRTAIGLMYSLRLEANKVLTTPDGNGGIAGLCYEYVPDTELFSLS